MSYVGGYRPRAILVGKLPWSSGRADQLRSLEINVPDHTTHQVLVPTYQDPGASELFAFLRRMVVTRPAWTDHFKLQKTVELGLMVVGAARAESFNQGDEVLTKLGWGYFDWLKRCAGEQMAPSTVQRLEDIVRIVSAEIQQVEDRDSKETLDRNDFIEILNNQMRSWLRERPSNTESPSSGGS